MKTNCFIFLCYFQLDQSPKLAHHMVVWALVPAQGNWWEHLLLGVGILPFSSSSHWCLLRVTIKAKMGTDGNSSVIVTSDYVWTGNTKWKREMLCLLELKAKVKCCRKLLIFIACKKVLHLLLLWRYKHFSSAVTYVYVYVYITAFFSSHSIISIIFIMKFLALHLWNSSKIDW